jgi:hypothetical protein
VFYSVFPPNKFSRTFCKCKGNFYSCFIKHNFSPTLLIKKQDKMLIKYWNHKTQWIPMNECSCSYLPVENDDYPWLSLLVMETSLNHDKRIKLPPTNHQYFLCHQIHHRCYLSGILVLDLQCGVICVYLLRSGFHVQNLNPANSPHH